MNKVFIFFILNIKGYLRRINCYNFYCMCINLLGSGVFNRVLVYSIIQCVNLNRKVYDIKDIFFE